jgi:hypothetical protein
MTIKTAKEGHAILNENLELGLAGKKNVIKKHALQFQKLLRMHSERLQKPA